MWHAASQSIYFIDFLATDYSIGRFEFRTKEIFLAQVIGETRPSFIVAIEGARDQFIIGLEHQAKRIAWDGRSPTATVIDVVLETETQPFYATNHFHFGKVDPCNRFYFGTIRSIGLESRSERTVRVVLWHRWPHECCRRHRLEYGAADILLRRYVRQ